MGARAPEPGALRHDRARDLRRARLPRARPGGGPAVHVQGHGGAHQLARRHGARGRASSSPTGSRRSCRRRRASTSCAATRSPASRSCSSSMKDSTPTDAITDTWYQVRKKVGDIRHTLPAGIQGPFFNDEFGDTFGNIYALTGDGFTYAELKEYADRIRAGAAARAGRRQGRARRRAGREDLHRALERQARDARRRACRRSSTPWRQQNAVAPAGSFETATDQIYLRASGAFDSVESDPRDHHPRERPALPPRRHRQRVRAASPTRRSPRCASWAARRSASAVSMAKGGDIIELGQNLDAEVERASRPSCRWASSSTRSTSQPAAVKRSVSEFMRTLAEAVVIVLAVSFVSLGPAHRPRRRAVHPARARRHLPLHAALRHRPAQDLAGRADHRARACWWTTRSSRSR